MYAQWRKKNTRCSVELKNNSNNSHSKWLEKWAAELKSFDGMHVTNINMGYLHICSQIVWQISTNGLDGGQLNENSDSLRESSVGCYIKKIAAGPTSAQTVWIFVQLAIIWIEGSNLPGYLALCA